MHTTPDKATRNPQRRLSRARGALLGLAVGDAIGTTVEFKPRGQFPPVTDMVGGGPFHLKPGQWTDDTSMALCLADSLLRCGFNLEDQIRLYLDWHRHGYRSSTGTCFDIGIATSSALARYARTGNPRAGAHDAHTAGNGCIMRLAPVVLYFQSQPRTAIRMAMRQAITTHGAPESRMACALMAEVLLRALAGQSKAAVMAPSQLRLPWGPGLASVAAGAYQTKTEAQIKSDGYVVHSLEAALWCFHQSDSYRECVLRAANLGYDADTTAAIAGQIAGAFYGEGGIPGNWLALLQHRFEIEQLANKLSLKDLFRHLQDGHPPSVWNELG